MGAVVCMGPDFAPPTFGLCDLAHLSVRVGLYGCGGQGRNGGIGVFQSKTGGHRLFHLSLIGLFQILSTGRSEKIVCR